MRRLKADFHTHTSDDDRDQIHHSAEMLIDEAAEKQLDVLAITNHCSVAHSPYLAEYAHRRGILLIPGIEALIEGRHLLILNPDAEQARASTFDELRRMGRRDAVFIAPHPYFPTDRSLKEKLIENIDLFDAAEYHTFYVRGLNFNRKLVRVAREHRLPLVGNSDTHVIPYEDSTYTLVEAEPRLQAVLQAIREGRVEVLTRPRPFVHLLKMIRHSLNDFLNARVRRVVGTEGAV